MATEQTASSSPTPASPVPVSTYNPDATGGVTPILAPAPSGSTDLITTYVPPSPIGTPGAGQLKTWQKALAVVLLVVIAGGTVWFFTRRKK